MSGDQDLFGPVPPPAPKEKRKATKELTGHMWTEQKSLLIAEYLHRFLIVTRSGAYLDLFAGPQDEKYGDDWSVKRVIERRQSGLTFRHFATCDLDPEQIRLLERLKEANAQRPLDFLIYKGDANVQVHRILAESPDLPTFCLIDQRTLECAWETVEAVAKHKSDGYKIEIFYFLAEGWLDRSWKSTKHREKLRRWWGRDDFLEFFHLKNVYRALAVSDRFRTELGYQHVRPWSIHSRGDRGRTMYYMIHASDHPRAPSLMSEAHNAVSKINFRAMTQTEMFAKLDSELSREAGGLNRDKAAT